MTQPMMTGDQDWMDRLRLESQARATDDPAKGEKSVFHYREPAKGGGKCQDCLFFKRETDTLGFCDVIQGVMSENGTSDLFTTMDGVKKNKPAWDIYESAGHRPPSSDV